MLQTFKKVLANSEPSTHGGKADIVSGWMMPPGQNDKGAVKATQYSVVA
jgi:hypothetical protein